MDVVDHLPGTHGPVVLGVGGAPLLGAVEAEDNVVLGLVVGVDHGLGHGQHQANGAVVVLEAGEVDVVVAAHDDLVVGGLAGDAAQQVVGGAALADLVVHHQLGGDGALGELFLDGLGVGKADGQGGDGGGAADVLAVEGVVGDLGEAPHVGGQDGGSALVLGLQHGVGDPPVGALVDVDEDDLARHVQALVVPHGTVAHVDDLGGEALGGGGGGGVGVDVVFLPVHGEAGPVELPAVAVGGGLLHVGKADLLHEADEVVGGGVLGVAAGVPAAQLGVEEVRVGGELQGHVIGVVGGDGGQEGLVGGAGVIGGGLPGGGGGGGGLGRGAAGGQAGEQPQGQEQCGESSFQFCVPPQSLFL